MEFNIRFKRDLADIFYLGENNASSTLRRELNLDSNNVFRKNLIVDLEGEELEIPVIARIHCETILTSLFREEKITPEMPQQVQKIVLPLYDNTYSITKRTFDSVIRQFFAGVSFSDRLQKIITVKGEVYYGGKGIILDKDLAPILLCTLKARKGYGEYINTITYYRPVCHISPKVFTEPTSLMNKGIIKRVIPFYTTENITIPDFYMYRNVTRSSTVEIIIDDFSRFFVEPVKPTPSTCSNEILNQCLVDNLDDIG